MLTLPPDQLQQALEFLRTQARSLEHAQACELVTPHRPEEIWRELEAFRNPDGGFGHGLEPDVRTPSSSAIATSVALHLLRETDCPSSHPLVRGAIEYLSQTYDPKTKTWRAVPEDVNDYPHAPWWHDADGSLEQLFDDFLLIPRAHIASHLHAYATLVPSTLLAEATDDVIRHVETVPVLGEGGGSDLEYVVELAQTAELPHPLRERLLKRIRCAIPDVVVRDRQRWSTYCLTPLRAVRSPNAPGADLIPSLLQENLDFIIAQQQPDGSWHPTWTWGSDDEAGWQQAKRDWQGVLTVEHLTMLKRFGRMAA